MDKSKFGPDDAASYLKHQSSLNVSWARRGQLQTNVPSKMAASLTDLQMNDSTSTCEKWQLMFIMVHNLNNVIYSNSTDCLRYFSFNYEQKASVYRVVVLQRAVERHSVGKHIENQEL